MCAFYVPHELHQKAAQEFAPAKRTTDIRTTTTVAPDDVYHSKTKFFNNFKYNTCSQTNNVLPIQSGTDIGYFKDGFSRNEIVDTNDTSINPVLEKSKHNINNLHHNIAGNITIFTLLESIIGNFIDILQNLFEIILFAVDFIILKPIHLFTDLIIYGQYVQKDDFMLSLFIFTMGIIVIFKLRKITI